MLKENVGNILKYTKLTPEEQKQRGILGRLVGVMADFKHPTRNGRLYNESLWDRVFKDPIMQEKIKNRCAFGELGHPENRQEVDMEKIAICLAEEPKKCQDGTIQGVFDILDTPNGRILKALCDYGCNIGVSSRGSGDVIEGYGEQGDTVDPETYECECWDAVLIPAVKNARPVYMTESYNGKTLKQALTESYDKESEEGKRVVSETLDKLNIEIDIENKPEKVEDKIKEEDHEELVAEDNGTEILDQLQESLKKNVEAESKLLDLQEKLSVCYAKEAKYEEELGKYKSAVSNMSNYLKEVKNIKSENDSLKEQLKQKSNIIDKQKVNIRELTENLNSVEASAKALNESFDSNKNEIRKLRESLVEQKKSAEKTNKQLQETIEELKQDSSIKTKEYSQKLSKANQLVEKYKEIASRAVDKYIESKARMLGVSSNEIKNRLNENYSFGDIDRACDSIKSYKLNISKLPFSISKDEKINVKLKESKEYIIPKSKYDDDVDDSLNRLVDNTKI